MKLIRAIVWLAIIIAALGYATSRYADQHMHFEPVHGAS